MDLKSRYLFFLLLIILAGNVAFGQKSRRPQVNETTYMLTYDNGVIDSAGPSGTIIPAWQFHAAILNHWIPLIAIGKAEKWSLKETMAATNSEASVTYT